MAKIISAAEAAAKAKSPKSPQSPEEQQIVDVLATKTVAKKRMITDNSVSVVEITLQIPLPFVHLSKWKRAVIVGLPARRQACTPDHVDISGVVFKGQGICLHALSLRAEDL